MIHYCTERRLNLILKLKSSDAQRINPELVGHSFVANLVSYISE